MIVLVDSRRRVVEVQARNTNGTWTLDERTGGDVQLARIDVLFAFDAIYDVVGFSLMRATAP